MSEATANSKRMRAYRERRRRFDYTPSERALAAIQEVIKLNPQHTINHILDALVVRAVTGNK